MTASFGTPHPEQRVLATPDLSMPPGPDRSLTPSEASPYFYFRLTRMSRASLVITSSVVLFISLRVNLSSLILILMVCVSDTSYVSAIENITRSINKSLRIFLFLGFRTGTVSETFYFKDFTDRYRGKHQPSIEEGISP